MPERDKITDASGIAASGTTLSTHLSELTRNGLVEHTQWRRLARTVARRLGRPVQTIVIGDRIHASLRDWPANALGQPIHDAELRRAVNVITLG